MIQSVWRELPGHYHGVELDAFVVMPNHVHGIVILVGAGPVPAQKMQGNRGDLPTSAMSLARRDPSVHNLTTTKYRRACTITGGRRSIADCGSATIMNTSSAARKN